MNDNDDETLDYVSSVDPFTPEKEPASIDAADEKTLEKVAKLLADEKETYTTIGGMKRFDKKFSADEREALCDEMVKLISTLEGKVNIALGNLKEKQNARRR